MVYLCIVTVQTAYAYAGLLNRESGESPEQSRCCVFRKQHHRNHQSLEGRSFGKADGGGNESEDLPLH